MGVGDYLQVQIPASRIFPGTGPSPLTIEAWIYPKAYTGNGGDIIGLTQDYINGNCSPPGASQWVLYDGQNIPDAPELYANAAVLLTDSQWNQAVTLNTWHLIKITFDGNATTKVYIDASPTPLATSTCPPRYDAGNFWTVTLGNFVGDIDEVWINNTGQ